MGNMKFWWIFGFEWWGDLRPVQMETISGSRYIPLFLGIWLRVYKKRVWNKKPPYIGHPDDIKDDPIAKKK